MKAKIGIRPLKWKKETYRRRDVVECYDTNPQLLHRRFGVPLVHWRIEVYRDRSVSLVAYTSDNRQDFAFDRGSVDENVERAKAKAHELYMAEVKDDFERIKNALTVTIDVEVSF